jgi:hypothetical protein
MGGGGGEEHLKSSRRGRSRDSHGSDSAPLQAQSFLLLMQSRKPFLGNKATKIRGAYVQGSNDGPAD